MEQSPLELTRLDLVLLARELVDDGDPRLRVTDPVAQLGGQYHWIFSPLRVRMPSSSGTDSKLRALLGEEHASRVYLVARIPLAHRHLVGLLIGASRGHGQGVAHRPEAQEADSELALQACAMPSAFSVA